MSERFSNEEMKKDENVVQETGIARKVIMFLEEAGITDYSYSKKEDGVHVIITLPDEHKKERGQQRKSLLGALPPTRFETERLLPFLKRIRKERKLDWKLKSIEYGETDPKVIEWHQNFYEIIIFKDKFKIEPRKD